jgi:hypothetical protein
MAETAEQINTVEQTEYFPKPNLRLVEDMPVVLAAAIPEMEEDKLVRLRAARFIGACIVGEGIKNPTNETATTQPIESLHDAINKAAGGDPVARKMIGTNARTDVIERTIKAGHVIKVDLQVDEAGNIQQHGQSMESVHANSLRLAGNSWQMQERTEAETTNSFRIKHLHEQGKLKDYYFVVFSRAADNMTNKQMTDAGFFTDTMSCVIQATTEEGYGLTTESAFVAGVTKPGGERHDAKTVVATAEKLEVDLSGKTAAEIINIPLLVHKSLMSNGVIDVVKLYDESAGGTFFGEERPNENYLEYLDKCKEREFLLQPKVEAIVEELIAEASKINSPLEAIRRLHKLSEKHMVEQAVFDKEINPQVFGPTAAVHIEEARTQFELGNYNSGFEAVAKATATAESNSCPSGLSKATESGSSSNSENSKKECDFISKECPICHEKNVKTTVKKISDTKTIISGSCGCAIIK